MRLVLLLLLLPALASAQFLPPSGSGSSGPSCGLVTSVPAYAASMRITSTSNLVPGVQCDAILDKCVKFGPGADAHCGTNAAGEVVCGRSTGTGVWRFYGTSIFATASIQNLTVTNVAAIAFYQQTTSGSIDNPNGVLPVLVNDAQGFRVTCKTALTTCAVGNESTIIPICGTGGAFTKQCLCTGDGTTYAWRNLLNPTAGAGTSTTCPAT